MAEETDDGTLVVRLHHEVVDTPAPRQAFTPAQALRLASRGPLRATEGQDPAPRRASDRGRDAPG